MVACIYKISFESGDTYIGQTTNYEKRKYNHSQTKGLGSPKLYKAFVKEPNPTFSIMEECSVEELNDKEIYYINTYKPTLNILLGGNVMSGLNHPRSKYTKEQLEEVLSLFLNTSAKYHEIASITGVGINTVHDICKLRTHTWLTSGITEEQISLAKRAREVIGKYIYTKDGNRHLVTDIGAFEKEFNVPPSTVYALLNRTDRGYNKYGMSAYPPRKCKITTPEKEEFYCNELEALEFFSFLPQYSKQRLREGKSSKGFSLKYLDE